MKFVQYHDKRHVRFLAFCHAAKGTHNQEEYKKRCDSAKCSDEQISENGDCGRLWENKSQSNSDDQTADNAFDQTDVVPFLNQIFHVHFPF